MRIKSTPVAIDEQQAAAMAVVYNGGIVGKIFDWVRHKKENSIHAEEIRMFYYPYYCTGSLLHFRRAAGLKEKTLCALNVVEGVYGTVMTMNGRPMLEEREVERDLVVQFRCDEEKKMRRLTEQLVKVGYKKYHSIPKVEIIESETIYKPHYAVLCRRGSKKFWSVVDAETGERNYMLDIKYPELRFCR